MSELTSKLRDELLADKEYAHAYMESVIDAYIATQLKVLREQRDWSQETLATQAEMKQERISVLESVNYSSWSINTLRRLARAFDLVVTVSFENFGTELSRVEGLDARKLRRTSREEDLSRMAQPGPTIERTAQTSQHYVLNDATDAAVVSVKQALPPKITTGTTHAH
jgi:transcriptional regulator with XRE-family HTH domain